MKNFWRHILRNKTYAFINLFGLSLGLTVTTLIILYVQREFDYDNYLPGYDRVIRIQPVASSGEYRQEWAASEGFLVPALTGMFEEIEAGTRIMAAGSDLIFRRDSLVIAQKNVILADENFFDVLPYSFVYGDRATALRRPDGIVLARSMAEKLFGPGNPVGRILTTSFSTFQVTGVIEEIPERSHLHFSAVFPLRVWIPDADQSRQMYAFYSYLRLKSKEQVNPFILNKLAPWYAAHGYDDQSGKRETEVVLGALPIADIHLRSHAEKELEPNGQLQIVYLFVAVAALVLIIATLNYVNLSNALAIRRSREVAIRKTVGASRQRLFVSFMTESALFTLAAFLLSLALDALLLSRISFFGGPALTLSGAGISYAVLIGIAVWLMLGLLAGLYPATVLSSFDPIQALRAAKVTGRRNGFAIGLRRGLIVFQFAISSFMVVCAFTIRQQMLFIEGRDLGFDKDHVLTIPLMDDAQGKAHTLKSEMLRLPAVQQASVSSVVPGRRVVYLSVRIPGLTGKASTETQPDGTTNMRVMSVDSDFVETMGLQIVEGRDFSTGNTADLYGGFLLNEAAVKEFGLRDPVGHPFEYVFGREPKKGKVIGVVKDFHFASMHSEVEPLMLHYDSLFMSTLSVRLKPGDVEQSVAQVENTWHRLLDVPFSFQFLDTEYDALYRSERNTSKVITVLTLLALAIACLGLFGIVSFFVAQRTREVGIRKVFGASPGSLFAVLANEYILMVILGNVAAVYPAFAVSSQWLQQFSYHADISWLVFLAALCASCLLAIISILYVILKTSTVNPAVILRHE